MNKYFFHFDFDGDEQTFIFYGDDYGDAVYWAKLKCGDDCEDYLVEWGNA